MTTARGGDCETGRFSDAYRRMARELLGDLTLLRDPAQLSSSARIAAPEGEKLLRRIWFDQYLRPDGLRVEDGRSLRVISPGWWNGAAGPDFQNAEFQLGGGETVRADVELHVASSDWRGHGHDSDAAYSRVGLHVVMENDTGDSCVAMADGTRIPQLVAAKFLSEEVEEIADQSALRPTPTVSPGECLAAVARAGDKWVGGFLDAAGDERMVSKAERFRAELSERTLDDILFEGVMDALGFRNNRQPFRRLAKRLPLRELKRFVPSDAEEDERALLLEAALFGVSGLIPDAEGDWDDETRAYVERLTAAWSALSSELGGRAMQRADWEFGATRPLNRPERRIAGAARWLAVWLHAGLFRSLLSCMERAQPLRNFERLFSPEGGGYWDRRCSFGGKPLARVTRLVGGERGSAIVVNVAVPLVLCEARRLNDATLEGAAHDLYCSLRPLSGNRATRYVAGRMFPSAESARVVVNTARRQQGLQQLFADFCHAPDATCGRCLFRAAAGAARSE